MTFEHRSVLLNETVDSLNIKPDGIYVDGTLGGGGHAYEVAKRLGPSGRIIGIDQDADAIAAATERLKDYKDKVTIVRSNYRNIREVLEGSSWIWEFLRISWTSRNGDLPTGRTPLLTCGWTRGTKKRRQTS